MHPLRRITLYPLFGLSALLSVVLPSSQAATSPANIMSRAMIAMMDTLGDLAHRYKGSSSPFGTDSGWSGSPWGNPGWGYPGYMAPQTGLSPYNYSAPGFGALPLQGHPTHPHTPNLNRSALDGIWIGRGGEIVLVMYGHFRIYANEQVYRDGRYRIAGNKLYMLDPQTQRVQQYDYALDNGRMIMRSKSGAFLYFKQLPIPIPPYSLIQGKQHPNP
jgi:hypothetical protein